MTAAVERTGTIRCLLEQNPDLYTEWYILTGFYLHITDTSGLDQETPLFQFTLADYDRLSGLGRDLAACGEGTGADILLDFKELLDILSREVNDLLARKNDILDRFEALFSMGVTPELVQQMQKALEEAKGEAE